MSVHTYPARALRGDYLRALAGTVPCLVILAAVPLAPPVAAVMGGLAAVFAAFGLRTVLRRRTHIEMSDRALCASGPRRVDIPWAALDAMKLSYYALGRDGGGWMQLVLRAGPAKLSLDSRIEGFALIVERAARAAATRRLPLSAATLANLQALDLMPAEPPAAALRAAGEWA